MPVREKIPADERDGLKFWSPQHIENKGECVGFAQRKMSNWEQLDIYIGGTAAIEPASLKANQRLILANNFMVRFL